MSSRNDHRPRGMVGQGLAGARVGYGGRVVAVRIEFRWKCYMNKIVWTAHEVGMGIRRSPCCGLGGGDVELVG